MPAGLHGWKRLVAASAASNYGDGIRLVALPLLVLDQGTWAVTAVFAAAAAPGLVLAAVAGVVADRADRRTLILGSLIVRAVVMAGVAALAATGSASAWLVATAAVAFSAAEVLGDTASQALLPVLAGRGRDLERANSGLDLAETVGADLAGNATGSVAFAAGPAVPFAASAALFTTAARLNSKLPPLHPAARTERALDDLRAGIGYVRTSPLLRLSVAVLAALGFVQSAVTTILVLHLTGPLGLSEAGYGLFLTVGSVGGVLGGILGGRLHRWQPGTVFAAALVIGGLMLGALAATSSVVAAAVAYATQFAAVVAGRIVFVSSRQRHVPDDVAGRVAGVLRTAVWGTPLIGALAGGALVTVGSTSTPIVVAAATYLGAGAVVARRYDQTLRIAAHTAGLGPGAQVDSDRAPTP